MTALSRLFKQISIYLSNSHMNWIRRITRHGIYCLFTLLQVTKWEQEGQLELGWAATSCTAQSQYTEYLHSIQYTVYTPPHRQVWPELAHQPGPRSALAACNHLPWNRDSITTLSLDYIIYYIFPIHIHAFKGQLSALSKNENKVIFIIYLKGRARYTITMIWKETINNNILCKLLQMIVLFLSGEFRMCQMYLLLLCPGHE